MRIIFIRHGQSMNNQLTEISYETYTEKRTEDPNLTTKGEKEAESLGRFLGESKIRIDKCKCLKLIQLSLL